MVVQIWVVVAVSGAIERAVVTAIGVGVSVGVVTAIGDAANGGVLWLQHVGVQGQYNGVLVDKLVLRGNWRDVVGWNNSWGIGCVWWIVVNVVVNIVIVIEMGVYYFGKNVDVRIVCFIYSLKNWSFIIITITIVIADSFVGFVWFNWFAWFDGLDRFVDFVERID